MARKPISSAETIRRLNAMPRSPEADKKTPWKDLPEHVRRNILRVREAERKRKEMGGALPVATFVSGGKVSPR